MFNCDCNLVRILMLIMLVLSRFLIAVAVVLLSRAFLWKTSLNLSFLEQ